MVRVFPFFFAASFGVLFISVLAKVLMGIDFPESHLSSLVILSSILAFFAAPIFLSWRADSYAEKHNYFDLGVDFWHELDWRERQGLVVAHELGRMRDTCYDVIEWCAERRFEGRDHGELTRIEQAANWAIGRIDRLVDLIGRRVI